MLEAATRMGLLSTKESSRRSCVPSEFSSLEIGPRAPDGRRCGWPLSRSRVGKASKSNQTRDAKRARHVGIYDNGAKADAQAFHPSDAALGP